MTPYKDRKTGRHGAKPANKRTEPWQRVVGALAALVYRGEPMSGAVAVTLRFVMPRPKSHFVGGHGVFLKANAPRWPTAKPDGDKLERCVWDALVKARVLRDDALVVRWSGSKVYDVTHDAERVAQRDCGVWVKVERLT